MPTLTDTSLPSQDTLPPPIPLDQLLAHAKAGTAHLALYCIDRVACGDCTDKPRVGRARCSYYDPANPQGDRPFDMSKRRAKEMLDLLIASGEVPETWATTFDDQPQVDDEADTWVGTDLGNMETCRAMCWSGRYWVIGDDLQAGLDDQIDCLICDHSRNDFGSVGFWIRDENNTWKEVI